MPSALSLPHSVSWSIASGCHKTPETRCTGFSGLQEIPESSCRWLTVQEVHSPRSEKRLAGHVVRTVEGDGAMCVDEAGSRGPGLGPALW